MPDVSVVISTYNRETMLREALACALGQDGVDLEVVVVDNGSSDGTERFLAGVEDHRVRIIRNELSLGPTGGRNTGLAAARGRWVSFLDDDDLWAPDKLRRQLDAATAAGAGWVYTGCVYIDARRRVLGGGPAPTPDEVVRTLPSAYVIPAGLSSICFRRGLVDGDGLLDERLRWQTDWDLSLRLLRTGPPAAVHAPLVAYRQHAGQVSQGASRYEPELRIMADKFSDVRGGSRRFDRGVQYRFIGSEALRGGQRRVALSSYAAAVRAGDVGSLLRSGGVLLPRRMHPFVRRAVLSDREWIAEAERWLAHRPSRRCEVVFVQRTLRRYRLEFLEQLRAELDARDITLTLLHANSALGGPRCDGADLPWAVEVTPRIVPVGPHGLVWYPVWGRIRDADLVVTEQASRMLLNVVLALRRAVRRGPPFALWGHGANLDAASLSRMGERVKRWITRRADWWFAYTHGTAEIVRGVGFPGDRITVFLNATDTTGLAAAARALGPVDVGRVRRELAIGSDHACLFLGNFADAKRLDLLLAACDAIREQVPDFELLLVGSGLREPELRRAGRTRPWLRLLGQRFGGELAEVAAVCRLLLVPGWAGLSVVDSFALGLPIVVSGGVPHPPEVDYVESGVNGVVSDDDGDPGRYAATVVALLRDPERLAGLAAGARASADAYTVEGMVERVVEGLEHALASAGRPLAQQDAVAE